ncbi:MAG: stage II sporulation protein D [Bacillota bacterium]|jgi:stage II sporulation protein D
MRPNHPLILLLFFTLLVLIPLVLIEQHRKQQDWRQLPFLLRSKSEGKTYRLGLEEYLVGVIAAEMPAEFAMEALKAQAVASRTVALRRLQYWKGGRLRPRTTVVLSDDPTECQAWESPRQIRQKWRGWNYYRYYRKIRRAVADTAGIILIYEGQPIDAVYHSTCGTGTVAADEIWPYRAPYLQRVSCGYDRHAPRYHSERFFTWRELAKALRLSEADAKKMRLQQQTASGRVGMVSFGKYHLTGSEFRSRLGLNSNHIRWSMGNSGVRFRVTGYGHGVGMCQYGADGMARRGASYRTILTHYYQGVQFVKIKY